MGRADEKWGEVPVAIVALNQGEALELDELTGYLGERLARFKLPKGLHVVDALPRNAGGKVLKVQRPRRIPGLLRRLLDRRRLDSLGEGRDGLRREPADHPRGEEAARVVHHDRRLPDLQDEVESLRQRRVGGVLPAQDLDELHLVGRREEVEPDEVGGARHAL